MADSLPPTTDEELAAIERRIDAFTGSDHYRYTVDGIGYDGHWAHDTHRLIAEVKRLKTDLAARRIAEEHLRRDVADIDDERAALAAKVEAARQGLAENLAEYEQVIASFKPPKTMSREEEEHRDLARAETAEARNCLAIFDAAMGSGMPHTPAQEPSIPMRYGPDCAHKPEWHCSAHGECRACECGCFTYPPTPAQEGHREAAQSGADGTNTSPAGSGRGTGVAETPGTAQAGDAWREFSRVIDEEEPDDILAAALDIPGLWADENQPEAPAEAEHVTAVRSTYRPGYASVLLRLIADAETTTPYYRRPVIVQDGAITDAGFLRDAVAAVWGAMPHLLPSLPVPSTERPRDA